jgi:sterol carrier protein 2
MFNDNRELVGYSMSKSAAEKSKFRLNTVYKKSGVSPKEIGVVELHDCFSANELVTYEAIQLCAEGKAG